MNIRLYQLPDIDPDKLQPLTDESFFTSEGFMNLWQHANGRPVVWIAEDSDGLKAALPAVEFGKGMTRRLQSMPDGCYGRLLFTSDNRADNMAVAKLMMREIAQAGYVKCFIYDFYGTLPDNSGFSRRKCETSVVKIPGSDWLPPDKKMQSEIRKAQREGVAAVRFEARAHMERFLALVRASEKRHGRRPRYSEKFFKALAALAEMDSRIIWWWCEHDGRAVTSHINFLEKDAVLNWQVYYDRSFSSLKANQFLLYSLAQHVHSLGLHYLNLGSTPLDASSLAEYKQKWGGQPYVYQCHWRKSGLGKIL